MDTQVQPARNAKRPDRFVGRILVVDDHDANRLVAELMLEMLGFAHEAVCGGLEALDCIAKKSYSAVLMDVRMPVLNGLETTRRIRAREEAEGLCPLPIIAVTAEAGTFSKTRCLEAGMNGFMTKPYSSDELMHVIESYVKIAV
jgi:CheY-like chemotaxis protein